jgi:tetratricopeptide (TPR) repeat protein
VAESNQAEIDRLLREGLNHYGTGDHAEAARCWRAVLEIDPNHGEARDYLETAGMLDSAPGDPEPSLETTSPAPPPALEFAEPGLDLGEPGPLESEPEPHDAEPVDEAPADDDESLGATGDALVREATKLFRAGELEGALDLFETVARRDAAKIEVQSYIEMLRSQLLKSYRERVGSRDGTVRLLIDSDAVMKFNLPTTAGFVLSLVDGSTSVNDLMSLSGLDAFDTLRILTGLIDAGIVEIEL